MTGTEKITYPENWTPYQPLRDFVILRPLNYAERVSSGGVIMPQDAEIQKAEGIVLAVGPGTPFEIPKHVLSAFILNLHQSVEGIELICGALERACNPHTPEFALGDTVFFPPWLAQWERHSALDLQFCCIHASQILGIYRETK
jgi:co-chaperonin GroES (HSP10)